jgi:hypothetical protein
MFKQESVFIRRSCNMVTDMKSLLEIKFLKEGIKIFFEEPNK